VFLYKNEGLSAVLVVLVNIVDIGTQKNNLDKDYGGSGVERKLLLP
jgi:hypothetical protein